MILTNEWLPKGASLIGQQSTEQRIFMMLSVVKSKVKSDCLESPNPNVMKISPLNSDHHHPYCDARIILLPIAAFMHSIKCYLQARQKSAGWRLSSKQVDFERKHGKHYYGFTSMKISN